MGKFKSRNIQGRKGRTFAENLKGVSLNQVLIVPIDAAKHLPKALICNYFGDILEESFFFSINSVGLNELITKIRNSARACKAQRILIGVEATGHYHEDIVLALGEEGLRQFSIKYQLRIRGTTIKRQLHSAELALIKKPEDLEIELLHLGTISSLLPRFGMAPRF